jgi:hypothetical protein
MGAAIIFYLFKDKVSEKIFTRQIQTLPVHFFQISLLKNSYMDEVRLANPAIKINIYFYKKMMLEFDKNVGGSSNIFCLNARRVMIYFKTIFCII